eukprot:scaffold123194_cov16-Tisochrysis_lutea.AAC.1
MHVPVHVHANPIPLTCCAALAPFSSSSLPSHQAAAQDASWACPVSWAPQPLQAREPCVAGHASWPAAAAAAAAGIESLCLSLLVASAQMEARAPRKDAHETKVAAVGVAGGGASDALVPAEVAVAGRGVVHAAAAAPAVAVAAFVWMGNVAGALPAAEGRAAGVG